MKTNYPFLIAVILVFMVLPIDLYLKNSNHSAFLYLPLLILVRKQHINRIIAFAFFIFFVSLIKPTFTESNYVIGELNLDGGVFLISLFMLTILMISHKMVIEEKISSKQSHLIKLEKLLFFTNHHLRSPVVRCRLILSLIKSEPEMKEKELLEYLEHMESSIIEFDKFTRNLNDNIIEIMEYRGSNAEEAEEFKKEKFDIGNFQKILSKSARNYNGLADLDVS